MLGANIAVPIRSLTIEAWSLQTETTLVASGPTLSHLAHLAECSSLGSLIRYRHNNDRPHLLLLLAYQRFGSSCSTIFPSQ